MPKRKLSPKKFVLAIVRFFSRSRATAKSQGEKTTSTYPPESSSSESPPDSPPPSTVTDHGRQVYCQLAQQVDPVLPQVCNRIEPEDVQITDSAPFSSGGSSDIWRGSLGDLCVVVKSLRLYSSPEFDPAEAGIVSHRPPVRLKWQC